MHRNKIWKREKVLCTLDNRPKFEKIRVVVDRLRHVKIGLDNVQPRNTFDLNLVLSLDVPFESILRTSWPCFELCLDLTSSCAKLLLSRLVLVVKIPEPC